MSDTPVHLGLLDDMDHEAKINSDLEYRESELRIHALGAAISRRDWHAVEQAHAAIRDKFYSHSERGKAEQGTLAEMTVTLCGSTRFKAAYIDWFQRLTDQGLIVLTVGRYLPKKDHGSQLKADLDTLHFRKIDRSSRILVLDVGGYIGDSTRNEIAHAERTGKQVEYLSQLCPDYVEPPLAETDIGRAVAAEQDKAVAAERERCAKIADAEAAEAYRNPRAASYRNPEREQDIRLIAGRIAQLIRARTLTEGKENSDGA